MPGLISVPATETPAAFAVLELLGDAQKYSARLAELKAAQDAATAAIAEATPLIAEAKTRAAEVSQREEAVQAKEVTVLSREKDVTKREHALAEATEGLDREIAAHKSTVKVWEARRDAADAKLNERLKDIDTKEKAARDSVDAATARHSKIKSVARQIAALVEGL